MKLAGHPVHDPSIGAAGIVDFPTESSGTRRAALLVHSMPTTERSWLLRSLPPTQRERIEQLLAELSELGIPRERGLLDDLVEPSRAPASDEEMLRSLSRTEVTVLIEVLRAEPAGLVKAWLGSSEWPWRHDVLRALGQPQPDRTLAPRVLETANGAAHRLQSTLTAAIAARVRAGVAVMPSPPLAPRTASRSGTVRRRFSVDRLWRRWRGEKGAA